MLTLRARFDRLDLRLTSWMARYCVPLLRVALVPAHTDPGGQYIVKNIVLVCAGRVIGATARGGRLAADPATPLVQSA